MRNLQPSEEFFVKNLVIFWLATGNTVHDPSLGTSFVRLDLANSLATNHRPERDEVEIPDVVGSERYVFSRNVWIVSRQRVRNLVPEISVKHAAR